MQSFRNNSQDGLRPAKERTILRRASGLLSVIPSPFIHHRASLSVDNHASLLRVDHSDRRFSEYTGWPQWDQLEDRRASRIQIIVETTKTVHTSPADIPDDRRPSRVFDQQNTGICQVDSQSQHQPGSFQNHKARSINPPCNQSYTLGSRQLRPESQCLQQAIISQNIPTNKYPHEFLMPLANASKLSLTSDELDSPQSETSKSGRFSSIRSSISFRSHRRSTSMQSRREKSTSCYTESQPFEHNLSSEGREIQMDEIRQTHQDNFNDYTSWINFEKPYDVKRPSAATQTTASSSTTSPSSLESPTEDLLHATIPRIKDDTPGQRFNFDVPFTAGPQNSQRPFSSVGETFGNSAFHNKACLGLPPSPTGTKNGVKIFNHTNPLFLRKKISQYFKDTIRKSKK